MCRGCWVCSWKGCRSLDLAISRLHHPTLTLSRALLAPAAVTSSAGFPAGSSLPPTVNTLPGNFGQLMDCRRSETGDRGPVGESPSFGKSAGDDLARTMRSALSGDPGTDCVGELSPGNPMTNTSSMFLLHANRMANSAAPAQRTMTPHNNQLLPMAAGFRAGWAVGVQGSPPN